MSTRYLQIARASLARAIRYADAHDLVGRNVATLIDNPKGQVGRPSRSLTLEESLALLEAASEFRLNAYVVLSLAVGIRTEEARNYSGITSTWTEIRTRSGLSRRRWPYGIPCGRAATPRRSCHGGRWRCPRPPCRLCGSVGRSKRRTDWRPGPCGRITTWSSPRPSGRRWMRRTSGSEVRLDPDHPQQAQPRLFHNGPQPSARAEQRRLNQRQRLVLPGNRLRRYSHGEGLAVKDWRFMII